MKTMTNERLCTLAQQGDIQAQEQLVQNNLGYIRKTANELYTSVGLGNSELGIDHDDLIQEGMIGLFKAIRDYQEDKEVSFYHFAELCISRQMYTAMEASQRKKHAPLNSYVSLYEETNEEGKMPLSEVLQSLTDGNPEDLVIDRENVLAFQEKINERLSKMERQVLVLTLQGLDYQQIAEIMEKPAKSIDNALQRIKGKLRDDT